MAADVDSVALVVNGAGQSAEVVGGFEQDGLDVGSLEELVGRSQACWSRSDDDGSFSIHDSPESI